MPGALPGRNPARAMTSEAAPRTDETSVEANGAPAKPQAVMLLAASNLQSAKPRYKTWLECKDRRRSRRLEAFPPKSPLTPPRLALPVRSLGVRGRRRWFVRRTSRDNCVSAKTAAGSSSRLPFAGDRPVAPRSRDLADELAAFGKRQRRSHAVRRHRCRRGTGAHPGAPRCTGTHARGGLGRRDQTRHRHRDISPGSQRQGAARGGGGARSRTA